MGRKVKKSKIKERNKKIKRDNDEFIERGEYILMLFRFFIIF